MLQCRHFCRKKDDPIFCSYHSYEIVNYANTGPSILSLIFIDLHTFLQKISGGNFTGDFWLEKLNCVHFFASETSVKIKTSTFQVKISV